SLHFSAVTLYSHSPFLPITPFILLQTSPDTAGTTVGQVKSLINRYQHQPLHPK
ncbi:hypothetical protein L9F63_004513, partial [Diploptera punctata]